MSLSSNFKEIWKIFQFGKRVLGCTDGSLTLKQKKRQQRYFVLQSLCAALVIINAETSVKNLVVADHKAQAILVGFTGFIYLFLTIFKFLLIKGMKSFEGCLKWCETLLENGRAKNDDIKAILTGCFSRSLKLFKVMVLAFPVAVGVGSSLGGVALSFLCGKVMPLAPMNVLWSATSKWYNMVLVNVTMIFSGTELCMVQCLALGIFFFNVEYILAALNSIKVILGSLKATMSQQGFKKSLKDAVDLHCLVIEQQSNLVNLSFWPILILELISYGMGLMFWTVMTFDRSQFAGAFSAFSASLPYIAIYWMNERFLSTYSDLRTALYESQWYEMKPKQRKMILYVMIMLDRPIQFRAGPFHSMTFEELAVFLNRIYSFGVVINKFVQV